MSELRLSWSLSSIILAKCPATGRLLLGGLGVLGVGRMWIEDTQNYRDRPDYAAAPVYDTEEAANVDIR